MAGGGQFRPPDLSGPVHLESPVPEDGEEHDDGESAEPESEKGAFEYSVPQALAGDKGAGGGGDLRDGQHGGPPVVHADLLAGVLLVSDGQLHLRHRDDGGGVPLVGGGVPPGMPGRDRDHRGRGQEHPGPEELAPHPDAVKDRLAAPEGAVAESCIHRWSALGPGRRLPSVRLAGPAVVVHRDRPFPVSVIRSRRTYTGLCARPARTAFSGKHTLD